MRLRMVMASLVLVVASMTVVPAWADPDAVPESGSILGSETAAAGPGLTSVSAGPGPGSGPGSAGSAVPAVAGCDPIAGTECLLPFPNDWFTTNARTPTGLRVNLSAEAMPRNAAGTPINPAQWNTADGFSPGSMLLAHVPGIDLAKTGAAPVTDVGWSLRRDAPIVIVDTRTGERWPYWTELDAGATDPARRMLIIRPAKNFLEGHRYAVALRRLKNAAGENLPVPDGFAALLDGGPPVGDLLVRRQRELRQTLGDLARAGVNAEGLHLAWDFTVASEQGIAGPMLAIRDQALAPCAAARPASRSPPSPTSPRTGSQRGHARSTGSSPSPTISTGRRHATGRASTTRVDRWPARPARWTMATMTATYHVRHPACRRPSRPARASLYGHGLLGGQDEVSAGNVQAMAGRARLHVLRHRLVRHGRPRTSRTSATSSRRPSNFPTLPDRVQQGMLNFLFLGPADERTRTASPPTRPSRTAGRSLHRRPASCPTTATARAASSAAP